MAITPGVCESFKLELMQGVHDFPDDTLKIALYSASATLSPSTVTAYTATGEVTGAGYTAGGETLAFASGFPQIVSGAAVVDFDNLQFSSVTLSSVGGGLIYNSTKANRAVAILHFGSSYTVDGNLVLTWPLPTAMAAILRGN